jgi:hypothetical protein
MGGVDANVADWLESGAYKDVSVKIGFYPDFKGEKKLGLRHIGLQGAIPPRIKGMSMPKPEDIRAAASFAGGAYNEATGFVKPRSDNASKETKAMLDAEMKKGILDTIGEWFTANMPTMKKLFSEEPPAAPTTPVVDPRDAEIARLQKELAEKNKTEDQVAVASFSERCIKGKKAMPSQKKALELTAAGRSAKELDALFAEMPAIEALDTRQAVVEPEPANEFGEGQEAELHSIWEKTKKLQEPNISFCMSEYRQTRKDAEENLKQGFLAAYRKDLKGARALLTKPAA